MFKIQESTQKEIIHDTKVSTNPEKVNEPLSKVNIPNFEDIKVSTKTFTASTNMVFDIEKISQILPITEYIFIQKRRGRKKKIVTEDPNKNVKPGSIISIQYMGKIRGVQLKPKKKKAKRWFRNSFTVVVKLDKLINFKVCRNGTFQMTGCKNSSHAFECVKIIWDCIKEDSSLYTYSTGENLEILLVPAMRNIDFSVGFLINREKLDRYITARTDFHCLLETSFGYTGVNIKVPLKKPITEMKIKYIKTENKKDWPDPVYVPYQKYIDTLEPKFRDGKINHKRYNTFLVFHSGKIIHSGLCSDFMRDTYYEFTKVIKEAYNYIEERIDGGEK